MRYMPILRVQQGEYLSLRDLTDEVAGEISPLMFQTPSMEDDADDVAGRRLGKLLRNWSGGGFYDPALAVQHEDVDIEALYGEACKSGPFAPVASPNQDTTRVLWEAAQAQGRAAIRVTDPYALLRPTLAEELDQCLESLGLTPQQVTLVFDLGSGDSASALSAVASLPRYAEWASIVVAAGSLVPTTAPATTSTIPRAHLTAYRTAAAQASRDLIFGDYGVLEADYEPPVSFPPAAKLVYTEPNQWFYTRGRSIAREGNEQIYELAASITDRESWRGRDYSWGDEWIDERANRRGSPGNAAMWIRVALTHHITHVVREDL